MDFGESLGYAKGRKKSTRLFLGYFLFLAWGLAPSIQSPENIINLVLVSGIDKRYTGRSPKLTRDFQKKEEVN